MVIMLKKGIKGEPHSPPYMMHKYWARRPHNVFREIIVRYTNHGDVILDPFCGGGVTVVEGLQLKRKVIGVDLNPLSTYVTEMEVSPVNLEEFYCAKDSVVNQVGSEIQKLYETECRHCGEVAICDWIEWKNEEPIGVSYICEHCGTREMALPNDKDKIRGASVSTGFDYAIKSKGLWFPTDEVPDGDKTSSIIKGGVTHFHQLFSRRNLLALSLLWQAINRIPSENSRLFLRFVFSSSLKWASRQSHRRGNIVEGWAMHAYWVYPAELEINVWNTFQRRFIAIARGKRFTNLAIGDYYRKGTSFKDLSDNGATCLLLNQSSTSLPINDNQIDAVITDPPYGGNVNYGELADFWNIWHRFGDKGIIDKSLEAVINQHQRKSLAEYQVLLEGVFSESYRVLKPGGVCAVTFNSKDLGVVAAFIEAVTTAGFNFHPHGLLYQPPIQAYSTTVHAKDLGAFTGDFIFTLFKENKTKAVREFADSESIKRKIEETIKAFKTDEELHRHSQAGLRQRLYEIIIPFLAFYAGHDRNNYWYTVKELGRELSYLEELMPNIKAWCKGVYKYK